jgi:hypothetical protein
LTVPLQIQSDALARVEFEDGKFIVDTDGSITATTVTAKKVAIDTSDVLGASLGKATLKAGDKQVVIKTTAVTTTSRIFTSINSDLDSPVTLVILNKDEGNGFTVKVIGTSSKDIDFAWWIVDEKK